MKKGRVEAFAINPKCVKLGELYGETDINTFEWSDGLIASATRKFSQSAVSSSSNTKLNERSTVRNLSSLSANSQNYNSSRNLN